MDQPSPSSRGPGPEPAPRQASRSRLESMPTALYFTPDAGANRLLASEPLAVVIGMLLDQQVPMEWAFNAPALLKERLGGEPLDATAIAEMEPSALDAIFRAKPALHRFPGSMAKRTQALCAYLVEHYGLRPLGHRTREAVQCRLRPED